MTGKFVRIFGSGPAGLAISLVLLGLAAWINARLDPPPLVGDARVRVSILVLSILLTAALVGWSLKSLPAGDRGNRLCTDGAFRHVRHPLYAAFLWVFDFGLAIYLDSWVFVLWAVLLHPVWHFIVRYEEDLMTGYFGEAYREYERRTGRFLPKFESRP